MNFLPLAAALAVGVYSAQYIPYLTAIITAVFLICLSFLTIRFGKKLRVDIIFIAIAFVAGILLYNLNSNPKDGSKYADRYATLHGCICSLPYNNHGINRYIVYADEIELDGTVQPFNAKVIVNSEANFNCGDSVIVHGQLKRIKSNASDDAFNSRNYYAARDIFYKTTPLDMLPSSVEHKYFSISYAANILRSKCSELIRRHYSGDIAAAFIAIITGDKHSFSEEYNDILTYTGTRHLFYPAFVHILLISLFIGLFSPRLPRRFRDIVLIIMLMLYMIFGASLSAVKSAAVLILLVASKFIIGSGTYMNSLSLFVLIAVLINPLLLFDAGFMYSIASSVIIRSLMPLFHRKSAPIRFLGKYLIFTVGLAPLSLYFFGRISVYSFLLSVIFVPLLGLILALSPLILLNCSFGTTVPFAWFADKFVMVLLHIPVFVDALPLSSITFQKPSVAFIIAFYFAMAAARYWHFKSNKKKCLCIAVALGLFASQLVYAMADSDKIRIHFIDVGQGDATLIQLPYSSNIIIDGGGSSEYSDYNIGENVFVPYLTDHGANIIQAAFVSHYHNDHSEGIIAALENLNVKHLFIPDIYPENEIRLKLEKTANENGTKVWHISKPMQVDIDDITIEVFPPSEYVLFNCDENDTSLFINVCYGEFRALFTGDMSSRSEIDLINRGIVGDAEVLKIAHHGSMTSTSEDLVNAVSPDYSLIGVAENNNYAHPHKDVVSRLTGSEILRTDERGNIVLYADKDGSVHARCDE